MASAIALYPASLGWRWSQESYSGRNIFDQVKQPSTSSDVHYGVGFGGVRRCRTR
jgi:hypothetical protein